MTTAGNFARIFGNGYEITPDAVQSTYQHTYGDDPVMAQNVGVRQHAPGLFNPNYALNGGFARRGMGAITAHNLLFPSGIGNANDTEFIITELLGNNAAPVQGDCAVLFDGTLTDYKRQNPFGAPMTYAATFKPRGKRNPPFPVLILDSNIKGSITSAVYDNGAESVGLTKGGVAVLQVYNPTGTQATGTVTLNGQPSDADTVTINGTVYTFKTALTPTAGQVLIGANTAATAANLFAAMTAGLTSGTSYAAGTTLVPAATIIVGVPSASNVITFTAVNSGTGGNAYTLAKSGVNLAVSAATFAGGVNGDTASIVLQTATTSGGSYTTRATFTSDGTVRKAERIEIAIGTILDRFVKVVATLSGSNYNFGFNVVYGAYYQA